ncbi:MAG: holo-ACP synthase [Candidatus Margulisiibacteriota bacterium]
MISGIGIDIIEIDRIKSAVRSHGKKFLVKILTDRELKYCTSRKAYKFPEMAARFAAKEAYSKAIGTGMAGIKFNGIEVVNNKNGKPQIAISGKIQKKVHVSLSHSLKYAVASVMVEK